MSAEQSPTLLPEYETTAWKPVDGDLLQRMLANQRASEPYGKLMLAQLDLGAHVDQDSVRGMRRESAWDAKSWVVQQGIALEHRLVITRTPGQQAAGGSTSHCEWRHANPTQAGRQDSLF